MASLESLCRPDSETADYARHVLKHKGWQKECGWTDPCENTDEGVGARREAPSHGESAKPGFSPEQEGWTKSFMTDDKMKLSTTWDFHKGDADPDPSVPHGHAKQDSRRNFMHTEDISTFRESKSTESLARRSFACGTMQSFAHLRWRRSGILSKRGRTGPGIAIRSCSRVCAQ